MHLIRVTYRATFQQPLQGPLNMLGCTIKLPICVEVYQASKAAPEQASVPFDKGTGTFGPTPLPHALRTSRIPYNVAFREVLGFVTQGLKDAGEQWTDQARQDMISTVLISASNNGLLSVWER